jgi:hypothetical protein
MRLYQIGIIALTIRHYRANERKGTSDYNTMFTGLGGVKIGEGWQQ